MRVHLSPIPAFPLHTVRLIVIIVVALLGEDEARILLLLFLLLLLSALHFKKRDVRAGKAESLVFV